MSSKKNKTTSSFKPSPDIEYEEPPKIMKEMANFLKERGHSCAMIVGLKAHQFGWCQQDVCPETIIREDMKARQTKQDEFVKFLESQGHTCISIQETYPSRAIWCGKTPCWGRKFADHKGDNRNKKNIT